MKYAIVDGQRREALRGLKGTCEVCEVPVTPRCGRFRVPHWSHPPGTVDHHWEPETEWHRQWKACFPEGCQEIVHQADNGERHFADVKTGHGHVIEFQNSPISEEERSSREAIYRPMFWVVNGLRLKGDRRAFFEALRLGRVARATPLTLVVPTENCLLLQKWENSRTLVLFDFGEVIDVSDALRFGSPVLWVSHPGSPKGRAVLTPVYRKRFLEAMTKGEPLKGISWGKNVAPVVRLPHLVIPWQSHRRKPRPPGRKRYAARKRRSWSGSGIKARRSWR
ncbi:hypothetical protein FHP25_14675 [Vineibacter terrae]|uniref:Competence protein n=1 Tax=Vineibacter terrae TaxID=2586908 RepID=A0A5C8PNF4_9HYPH|nr:hypothetical protein [Vineibacter terrae]TXL75127.1 hypothetical protein FHP25_14675 [Vineibacter terrae]